MAPKARGRRARGRGGRSSAPSRPTEDHHHDSTDDSQTVAGASNSAADVPEPTIQSSLETVAEIQQPGGPGNGFGQEQQAPSVPALHPETQQQDVPTSAEPSTTLNERSEQANIPSASSLPLPSQASQSSPPSLSASQPQSRQGPKRRGPGPRLPARRSKEEREALDRAEEERRRARELGNPGAAIPGPAFGTTAGRGRGRGWGDGRGGRGSGRGGFGSGAVVASGPFSSGTISADLRKRKRGGGIAGGRQQSNPEEKTSSDQNNAGEKSGEPQTSGEAASRGPKSTSKSGSKSGPKSKAATPRVKQEKQTKIDEDDEDIARLGLPRVKKEDVDGGYISSGTDTENEGPRRNIDQIDHINLVSDEEDETGATDQRVNWRVPGPVRLPRRDGLALDKAREAETNRVTTAHDGFGEATKGDITSNAREGQHPRRRGNKGKDVEFIRDERLWQGVYQDDEDSDVHIKQEPSDDVMDIDTAPSQTNVSELRKEPPSSPEKKKRDGKNPIKAKVSSFNSDFHTAQDEDESARLQQDARTLLQELGQVPVTDGSETSEIRDGRVYLFQFPPVIPNLVPSDHAVKHEQDTSADQAGPDGPPPVISRPDKKPIKVEDSDTTNAQHRGTEAPVLSPGIAGKLRVHESGRTTLNWGGTSMELNMGSRLLYLQEVLVAKGLDGESGTRGSSEKEAFGLGVIRGKFVVTPDWEEIIP